MTDFIIRYHGSVTSFQPLSDAAKAWVEEHVAPESWQWMASTFVVDHRPADGLIAAIQDFDFEVEFR